jgi:hypothetical protein
MILASLPTRRPRLVSRARRSVAPAGSSRLAHPLRGASRCSGRGRGNGRPGASAAPIRRNGAAFDMAAATAAVWADCAELEPSALVADPHRATGVSTNKQRLQFPAVPAAPLLWRKRK